jgi:putative colanic acid biosynthesis glycosyltransferase WcaI
MNVALITQFFPPEPCAAANRTEAFAKALVRGGHNVTVVTAFPSFPQGRLAPGDRGCMRRDERYEGADLIRLLTGRFGRMPGARLAHWLVSATALTAYVLLTRKKFDVVIVSIPPITLALPALAAKLRHRAKLVLDVRDVFPDVAVAMGEWRANSFWARATERIARMLYRDASLIATVTPTGLAQISARGVSSDRLMLAPNGACDVPDVVPEARNGKFLALYTGNLGLATDVDVLADAARLLAEAPEIALQIVGGGAQSQRLQERIEREQIANLRVHEPVPRADAMRLLAGAGAALIPLRAGIRDSIPTKIFDALSVGCPVIVAADGEAAATALASGAGIAVAPGDAAALASAIRQVAALGAAGPPVRVDALSPGRRHGLCVRTRFEPVAPPCEAAPRVRA